MMTEYSRKTLPLLLCSIYSLHHTKMAPFYCSGGSRLKASVHSLNTQKEKKNQEATTKDKSCITVKESVWKE